MFKIDDFVTTIEKKPYPWFGNIHNVVVENGMEKYKCYMQDVSDVFIEIYEESEIRHYASKELADEIFKYYAEQEHPDTDNIYSKEFMHWLNNKIEERQPTRLLNNRA